MMAENKGDTEGGKGSGGDRYDLNRDRRYQQRLARLMATAWRDTQLMERLRKDPRPVLEEFEIRPPKDRKIFVHFDTANEIHIVIPAAPPDFGDIIGGAATDKFCSKCWNLCD